MRRGGMLDCATVRRGKLEGGGSRRRTGVHNSRCGIVGMGVTEGAGGILVG